MASSSTALPIQTFSVNERVLCYHGPLIYEAKVLKVENWDETNTKLDTTGPHYFVHYKGWKQTWDEWVHPSRLLKLNETNLALQKSIQQANAAANASAAGSSGSAPKGGAAGRSNMTKDGGRSSRKDGTRGTKRGREEDDGSKKPEMKLNVPEILKVILVDDWEAVTKNSQLVPLPRTPTVVQILDEFKQYILSLPKTNLRDPPTLLPTIIAGLQTYFDRALGANLLYRFERPQYAEIRRKYVTGPTVIVGKEKEMSQIYGAEHFLRMLVSLPAMVASSAMDPESVALIRDYVNELMVWMVKERERLFIREYESASVAYQNISRS
ncbi:MRG-domain-containing protein [Panus rudis PR-1116 ss-1]|nr:MRG-domain-containing protein [Panus rudis PR-1116 ss-1]